MKFLATILTVLVIQIVDAVEEEGDVNIVIEQNVVQPDVDECLEKIDACADNELCVNMPGTYRCACNDGFEKVKGICKDIDECLENCGTHGECVNSQGSFTCTCNEGFEEVEGICEDIDECKVNTTILCGEDEMCFNIIGNYTCRCHYEYVKIVGICRECKSGGGFYLDDLGCILASTGESYTWEQANAICQRLEVNLIEGINIENLEPIINKLQLSNNPWVGMKDSRWVNSQVDVDKDDEVWANGEPSLGNDLCGQFNMAADNIGLAHNACTDLGDYMCLALP